jgi:hypothetical protein
MRRPLRRPIALRYDQPFFRRIHWRACPFELDQTGEEILR